ncbi:MAG: ADP-glyceromanno-heptose 6-epimerase [Planctomycetes bacterium]|nr:ADP-glyceromanno-heptose 6-epimerase [Planctomycetota bacterium]
MIVVTGAAGFIGSITAARLAGAGRGPVVAVDAFANAPDARRTSGYLARIETAAQVDRDDLPAWLEKQGRSVEAIVHLGACSDTTATDREFMMRNNLEYTKSLWRWCTQARAPFLYASSAATYGNGEAGYDDEADPARLKPLNLYGESKHLFDLWALKEKETPPRWAGFKYFNVYGPNEGHKGRMASIVLHAWKQIKATGRVRLFKSHRAGIPDGGQKRDFVYVGDAVDATLHFLDAPASATAPNGLYNVGTGQARTFADLAKAVFAALGLAPNIDYVDMPQDLRAQYQYFTQACVAKLRTAGFTRPFRSIEEGVQEYITLLEAEAKAT